MKERAEVKHPFVSIIVIAKGVSEYLAECIENCLNLDYPKFEIIFLPDKEARLNYKNVSVVPTGETCPAMKRNMGVEKAKGEIIAFIDDDVYPARNWLKNATANFIDPEVAAVGGPAVTPDNDDIMQKASGLVYSSKLVSGEYAYRYIKGTRKEVEDFPSCNLIVRKSAFEKSGGFKTNFWPGEDTVLCLDIIKKLKKKIIYEPEAIVYHHRRRLFREHLKQVSSYAEHRGYFVKRFPETSKKFSYFVPSIFATGVIIGGIVSVFSPFVRIIYITILVLYLLLAIKETTRLRNFLVMPGIILTHITYGIFFIKGLLSRKLEEE
ncbi:glycosyltransferase [bacterium]|nr:glycosyltransferase [bacterium]